MNTLPILERLYRLPARKLRRPRPFRWMLRRALDRLQTNAGGLTIAALGFALWIFSHVYYYNLLLDLESNVTTARAQIEVAQERRNHVQRNLMQLLRFYARYERDVLKDLTVVRKGEKAPEQQVDPATALARLDAVAEAYPSLQLTKTVQQFSEAIVASESNIEARASEYNQAVNVYINALHQFPGNLFGPIMGFEDHDYYAPADRAALEYREIAP